MNWVSLSESLHTMNQSDCPSRSRCSRHVVGRQRDHFHCARTLNFFSICCNLVPLFVHVASVTCAREFHRASLKRWHYNFMEHLCTSELLLSVACLIRPVGALALMLIFLLGCWNKPLQGFIDPRSICKQTL